MHNHCFDVASKMKLCSPKSATGQEEQNKREPFTALAVCEAAHGERVFHSHSLLTTPLTLQECQKKKPSALSVFSGRASLSFLVSLPLLRVTGVGAFGFSKGRDGWDAIPSRKQEGHPGWLSTGTFPQLLLAQVRHPEGISLHPRYRPRWQEPYRPAWAVATGTTVGKGTRRVGE